MGQPWHEHPETLREEIANALTHGLGVALAIAGLVFLIALAAAHGTVLETVSSYTPFALIGMVDHDGSVEMQDDQVVVAD